MIRQIDALKEAEVRRHQAVPSTDEFHDAAKEEMAISREIFEGARLSDEDTPQADSK